jgi:hypothetical protein
MNFSLILKKKYLIIVLRSFQLMGILVLTIFSMFAYWFKDIKDGNNNDVS